MILAIETPFLSCKVTGPIKTLKKFESNASKGNFKLIIVIQSRGKQAIRHHTSIKSVENAFRANG